MFIVFKNLIKGAVVAFVLLSATSSLAAVSDFTVCFSPEEHCDTKILSFLSGAKQTVDIAIYDLTLPSFAQLVAKLKHDGVAVRIVCDARESKSPSSLIPKLAKLGVPVKFGRVSGIMHNKFIILDGRMLETGSYNYTNNATSMNAENQIYLNNSEVVSHYKAQFEKLWLRGEQPH